MSMWTWEIHVEVWPHSSGNGRENDQKAAGDRKQTYTVRADSIDDALKLAKAFKAGLECGPMVWQAPIMSIAVIKS